MPFAEHRRHTVDHLLWLEQRNPEYAVYALDAYRRHPDCPCPDILTSIKAEKARRAATLATESPPSAPLPRS